MSEITVLQKPLLVTDQKVIDGWIKTISQKYGVRKGDIEELDIYLIRMEKSKKQTKVFAEVSILEKGKSIYRKFHPCKVYRMG